MTKTILALVMVLVSACTVGDAGPSLDAGTVAVDASADADNNVSQVCRNIQSGTNTDGYLFHQGMCSDEIDGFSCSDAIRVPAGSVGCCDTLDHWHPCTMEPTH